MFPGQAPFPAHVNQTRELIELLRKAVRRVRRSQPHPFYSMREIARFFHVPVPTVSLVYRKLEQEGLLVPLRGSMTLVQPMKMRPRVPVRAVVGIPIWLRGFLDLRDWRLFFIRFEEYLRQHQFAANFVFYHEKERYVPDFAERLLAHQFDIVIWFTPDRGVSQIRDRLTDNGVRFIAISGSTSPFPGHQYELSWSHALKKGLLEWKRDGITRVLIPRSSDWPREEFHGLMPAIRAAGLPHSIANHRGNDFRGYVASLQSDHGAGVIFDDDLFCTGLCNRAPEAMIRLFEQRRVLVTRSINLPDAYLQQLRVDMAYMDWYQVGRRIVDDLMTRKAFAHRTPVIFEAKWMPRVIVSEVDSASKF